VGHGRHLLSWEVNVENVTDIKGRDSGRMLRVYDYRAINVLGIELLAGSDSYVSLDLAGAEKLARALVEFLKNHPDVRRQQAIDDGWSLSDLGAIRVSWDDTDPGVGGGA